MKKKNYIIFIWFIDFFMLFFLFAWVYFRELLFPTTKLNHEIHEYKTWVGTIFLKLKNKYKLLLDRNHGGW